MPEASKREHDVLTDAADRLEATGAFDAVYRFSAPAEFGRGAGDVRAALVAPAGDVETLEWDDVTAGRPLCRMTFNVVVTARDDDPDLRDRMADRLLSVVRNALNGQSLAGLTFVQDTIVKGRTWLKEAPPERQIRCAVECVYEAPGWNDFNTSE